MMMNPYEQRMILAEVQSELDDAENGFLAAKYSRQKKPWMHWEKNTVYNRVLARKLFSIMGFHIMSVRIRLFPTMNLLWLSRPKSSGFPNIFFVKTCHQTGQPLVGRFFFVWRWETPQGVLRRFVNLAWFLLYGSIQNQKTGKSSRCLGPSGTGPFSCGNHTVSKWFSFRNTNPDRIAWSLPLANPPVPNTVQPAEASTSRIQRSMAEVGCQPESGNSTIQ